MKKRPSNRAIGYVRVSTDMQEISPDAQRQRIEAYCAMARLELVQVIVEHVSASIKLAKRPEGSKLAKLVKDGICHIVALKLDRLFRNTVDAITTIEQWEAAGIGLHLIECGGMSLNTRSSMGRVFVTMMAAFGEFERRVIAERTALALEHKRSKGERMGNVPYGYTASKNVRSEDGRTISAALLVENPEEMTIASQMRALRASGLGLADIATRLNDQGLKTRRGTAWQFQYVAVILKQRPVVVAAR
jgi:site-specific DNA recombinase